MSDFKSALAEAIPGLAPQEMEQMVSHWALLELWNSRINLTAVREPEEAARRHYAESFSLSRQLDGRGAILDVGSGAGFPGVPIAILQPTRNVYLLDSDQRKAVFLREATTGLPNVRVLAQRLDEVSLTEIEWVVSRAVPWREVAAAARKMHACAALLVSSKTAMEIPSEGTERIPIDIGFIVKFHVERQD